ncbi:MAG TPA: hypothetical protein GXZ90_09185 [Clostridiales bacterium]|nr:hypothetical protein [Clostridiales bacterium]
MKILICYSSNILSNAIASSTMDKHEKNSDKQFELERLNISKRSLSKYLNNEKNKPEIIYVLENDLQKYYDKFETLKKENKEIKLITYNKKVKYKPVRQPGNTLKTVVYYLYDKILYDMENNFEKVPMYRVARNANEIDIVRLYGFEANSTYAKRFMYEANNCYKTKEEAKNHLKQRVQRSIEIKEEEINRLTIKTNNVEYEIKELQREYYRISSIPSL